MPRSRLRTAVVLAAAAAVAVVLPATPATGGPAAPQAAGAAAPYLYLGWGNAPDPAYVMQSTGIRGFTMAFILSSGGCEPAWDGQRWGRDACAARGAA